MKYDFDEIIDRRGTRALKIDEAELRGCGDAIPMWVADMDFRTAPEIVEAVVNRARHGVFGYTSADKKYFENVSGWLKRRHGVAAAPERFLISPGVVFALSSLIRAVTKAGDGVLILEPVYYPFATAITRNDRRKVVSRLVFDGERYSVDFEDFERKIVSEGVTAFILCSPHNPVGRVWTREELETMGDICRRRGVFVISDEIHADFVFGGHKHLPFPFVKKEFAEFSAACYSPSKTFNLAGMQISNIYLPNERAYDGFVKQLDKQGYWEPNALGLTAAEAAYTRGEEWFNALIAYLTENFAFAREFLNSEVKPVSAVENEGTYLLWLNAEGLGLDDDGLKRFFVEKAGLLLDEGTLFGEGGSGFMRLNAACPRATLKKALERLAAAVQNLGK